MIMVWIYVKLSLSYIPTQSWKSLEQDSKICSTLTFDSKPLPTLGGGHALGNSRRKIYIYRDL